MKLFFTFALAVLLVLNETRLHSPACAATFHTVALTGQSAAGTDGVFSRFQQVVLNQSGQIAFSAEIAGGTVMSATAYGIWTKTPTNNPSLFVRSGSAADGFSEEGFYAPGFYNLVINDNSQMAFVAGVTQQPSGKISTYGVWKGISTAEITNVASFGHTVPGADPWIGVENTYGLLCLNNAGKLAFRSGVSSGGFGIWREVATGNLQLAAKYQDLAPNDPQGLHFGPTPQNIAINSNGKMVVDVNLSDGLAYKDYGAIYAMNISGQLERIAGPMDVIQTDRGPITILSSGDSQLNSSGVVAFSAKYTNEQGNGEAIISMRDGKYKIIAATRDLLPQFGPSAYLSGLGTFQIDDSGQVAYSTGVAGLGGLAQAGAILMHNPQGSLITIANTKQHLPGVPEDQVVSLFGDALNPTSHRLNGAGNVLVPAILESSSTGELVGRGLWIWSNGELKPVIRYGQQIDVDDGEGVDLRTVVWTTWSVLGNNQDGRPSCFNHRGQIALRLQFTDGTSGIFLVDTESVPEPSAFTLLLAFAATLAVKSFRQRRNGMSGDAMD